MDQFHRHRTMVATALLATVLVATILATVAIQIQLPLIVKPVRAFQLMNQPMKSKNKRNSKNCLAFCVQLALK